VVSRLHECDELISSGRGIHRKTGSQGRTICLSLISPAVPGAAVVWLKQT
jgi:hypothetical protein